MSIGGGIRPDQGAQVPPGVLAGKSGSGQQTGRAGTSAPMTGRGFSSKNSVSRQAHQRPASANMGRDRLVRLPTPRVDPAMVATPEMQAQVSQSMDLTEMMFTFDELMNQLSAEGEDVQGEESSLGSTVYGNGRKGRAKSGQQGGNSSGQNGSGTQEQQIMKELMSGSALANAAKNPEQLIELQGKTLEVFDKIGAIKSAPPEVLADLKEASGKLTNAMLSGNMEDVARMLSEIQTKIGDTRIKFDEQAIRTSRLKRSQLHTARIGKLQEALEKMKEAKTSGIIGKVFGAIATALAVVVAAVTIATGVGAKAGVMLIMAATIMVAMTVSQNTGNWMTNLGGLVKDEKAQLVLGLSWAIMAAALSLGAGLAGSAAKTTTDGATTAVQQGINAGSQAAQQGANAAAQGVQQGATTASQTAQTAVQQSATAAQEVAKNAAKTATDSVDEVAEQAAKVAVKGAQESAKEAAKEAAKATTETTAKEASKETAKQMAEISKKTMYFRRAGHIARFTEGASMAVDGASQVHSARVRHEGEMYQADAHEDLAYLTQMQMQMEDWMEAIQRVLQEIGEGQKIASDMLSQAQQNKFTISRNI